VCQQPRALAWPILKRYIATFSHSHWQIRLELNWLEYRFCYTGGGTLKTMALITKYMVCPALSFEMKALVHWKGYQISKRFR